MHLSTWRRQGSAQVLPAHQSQGGGQGGYMHENSRHTAPLAHIPPAIQPRLDHIWVPMEGNPAVRHIWVDFAEGATSAALTIL